MTSEITKIATIDENDDCYELGVFLLPADVVRLGDESRRTGQRIVEVSVSDIPMLIAALERAQKLAWARWHRYTEPARVDTNTAETPVGPSSEESGPPEGDTPHPSDCWHPSCQTRARQEESA